MPELPEVETIKRVLEPQIQGLVVEKVTVRRPEVTAYPGAEEFCRRLAGQTISHMARKGKFLVIWLNSNDRIVLHLRMTGCLLLTPAGCPEEKHTHIIFSLAGSGGKGDPMELRFSDTRRFGRFWLLGKEEEDTYSGIGRLGIEPLDGSLTAEYLNTCFGKRRKAVKECLLDQSAIAGIGNIYSDEILFAAGIYPARPANSLGMQEWEKLAAAIPERISYFTERNQITPEEYLETKGKDYRNTPFLQVYGQEGKPCPKCKTPLCRIVVGGRGSIHCPACQRGMPG
ncbi:bifunctional DNA-formamidopyrimidine glycosylase/DNA-(apurinic or apyrimidinic site) lyase [Clostridiaceae bacterium]|nr:bifunctional DNA-formamidopyrimidine glycosylase/DNA-(apurinic or apyrimidinic site) lyase [Clostridiaceae bacterium]RKI16535.1 bifunctional DNA-formamidopyrimidine glycosylase/DNA-(apurinic or apyrimidinic site) lyase [bacterium 1XD21-70]